VIPDFAATTLHCLVTEQAMRYKKFAKDFYAAALGLAVELASTPMCV